MKLSDLFQTLSFGELSQLSIGNKGQGILAENYPRIIYQLNAGLTDLHARFPLLQKEVIIQQYDQISKYYLRREYAQMNTESTQPIKYLIDTPQELFLDDVVKVLAVYDECGCELPLNDDPLCCSIFTPAFDIIQVSNPDSENAIFVTYQAKHPEIPLTTTDLSTSIIIPHSHEKALRFYIAAQIYANSPNQETSAKGVEWLQKYEAECQKIELLDLDNQHLPVTNTKPMRRGFV